MFKKKPDPYTTPNEPTPIHCAECGVMVDRHFIQKVQVSYNSYAYYCQQHRKPYDRRYWALIGGEERLVFYKEMEVAEDGTPIGYVKAGDSEEVSS